MKDALQSFRGFSSSGGGSGSAMTEHWFGDHESARECEKFFLLRVVHEPRAMELVWERRVGVWDNTRYHQEMLGLTIRTTCDPGPQLGEWEDASRYYRHAEEPKVTAPFSGSW